MYKEIPVLKSQTIINEKSGINVVYASLKDKNPSAPHLHTYYTIDIILHGNGIHFINGKKKYFKSGAVHLVRPSDIHYIYADKNTTADILTIRFDENIIPDEYKFLMQINHDAYYPDDCEIAKLRLYADAIKKYNERPSGFSAEAIKMNFSLILIMFTEFANMDNVLCIDKEDSITKALKYINEHFRENISLNQVATYINLTPQYFSTLFHKALGKTFSDYVSLLKINYAISEIKLGLKSTNVCFSSGFGSISNFNTSFRKHLGMSPSEYRRIVLAE